MRVQSQGPGRSCTSALSASWLIEEDKVKRSEYLLSRDPVFQKDSPITVSLQGAQVVVTMQHYRICNRLRGGCCPGDVGEIQYAE
jgi:hypothetical protein